MGGSGAEGIYGQKINTCEIQAKQILFAIIDFSQFLLMSVAPPQKVFKNLLQFKGTHGAGEIAHLVKRLPNKHKDEFHPQC